MSSPKRSSPSTSLVPPTPYVPLDLRTATHQEKLEYIKIDSFRGEHACPHCYRVWNLRAMLEHVLPVVYQADAAMPEHQRVWKDATAYDTYRERIQNALISFARLHANNDVISYIATERMGQTIDDVRSDMVLVYAQTVLHHSSAVLLADEQCLIHDAAVVLSLVEPHMAVIRDRLLVGRRNVVMTPDGRIESYDTDPEVLVSVLTVPGMPRPGAVVRAPAFPVLAPKGGAMA